MWQRVAASAWFACLVLCWVWTSRFPRTARVFPATSSLSTDWPPARIPQTGLQRRMPRAYGAPGECRDRFAGMAAETAKLSPKHDPPGASSLFPDTSAGLSFPMHGSSVFCVPSAEKHVRSAGDVFPREAATYFPQVHSSFNLVVVGHKVSFSV